jgi:hypothetical protein
VILIVEYPLIGTSNVTDTVTYALLTTLPVSVTTMPGHERDPRQDITVSASLNYSNCRPIEQDQRWKDA